MALPKFIITMSGHLRLGLVNQHKDLLKPGDSCLGGGYYHFDYTSNHIILDRSSYDFGKPRWHLLETLKVLLSTGACGLCTVMTTEKSLKCVRN